MLSSWTLEDILLLVVLWFVTSMLANLLWTRFVVLKYVGRAFMKWIEGLPEDKAGQAALYGLLDMTLQYMGTRQITTGKKIKVATNEVAEDGKTPIYKEVDEVLTPIDLIARNVGNYALMKMKGQAGGVKTQIGRMFQEELSEQGMGLSPAALAALAKGKVGPALAEVGLPFIMEKLNKKKGDTSSAAEWKV